MSLQNLILEIRQSASREEVRIRIDAKKDAMEITEKARKEAGKISRAAEKAADEAVLREKTAISVAEISSDKLVAQARKQMVELALSDAKKKSFEGIRTDSKYPKLFEALAKEAVATVGDSAKLLCGKSDLALAKKLGYSAKQIECEGGVVAVSKDGTLRADNALETLFEEKEEEYDAKAFELLFGKAKKK